MSKTYFDWLNEQTPTRWWHDSGSPDEILLARDRGALGVTTNPVLTYRTFQNEPDFWRDQVQAISGDLDLEPRAEALLRLVAVYAASQFKDVFQASGGRQGLALGQLNPGRAGDAAGMLAQARRIHAWGDNIAIKLPATRSGVSVVEELAAEGIPVCATLNVSVAQALAVAEIGELVDFGEQSKLTGLALIHALLDKLIDDTANYPRVMARLTNATILGGESGRVGEIERLIARHYELEFGRFSEDAPVSPAVLAQMTLGLYYGQVNHLLAYGLPFEAEKMRKDLRTMLDFLLKDAKFR
jgi:hypothetical protein